MRRENLEVSCALGLQIGPVPVRPERGGDSRGRQPAALLLGSEPTRQLTQARVVTADQQAADARRVGRRRASCRYEGANDAPNCLLAGLVKFARRFDQGAIDSAVLGDDRGRGPGSRRGAHEYQIGYPALADEMASGIGGLARAARRQDALEIRGLGVLGLRLAVSQQN